MTTTPWFGVHTGLQRTRPAELQELWRQIEEVGFDWISIWDHLYAADGTGDPDNLDAVACHAALATTTTRVRCGSLVYCAAYRHPVVLAKALTTIDHLSGGRAVLGLGGGWLEQEYRAFGYEFGTPAERLALLREAVTCIRSLFDEEITDFEGRYFTVTDARFEPKPVQDRLPIWVGGGGEQVTLRIVAEHADGWNLAFASPEQWRQKSAVLDEHCAAIGRDPAELTRTVNVGIVVDEEDLRAKFGAIADFVRPGVLMGSTAQMVDRIGSYVEGGAEGVILAVRAPFEPDALELFAAEVMPAVTS